MSSDKLKKAREYEEHYSAYITEEERPAFHLSPMIGWMNDPNGFSLYKGQYHLFYQYHPYSTHWGPMHWGHAVSKDLLHWEYLPAAIAPDTFYDDFGCFSGSAIELPDGRQLLMYTGVYNELMEDGVRKDFQTQCLAVGDGLDYEKVEGNPVLDSDALPDYCSIHDFRDPKIIPLPNGLYGAVVGARTDDSSGAILLYVSEDCFHWKFQTVLDRCYNEFGKMWECPDFFELDGKYVLITSPQDMSQAGLEFHNGNGTLCLIGSFDSENYKFDRERVQAIDYGIDFYAPQTVLAEDGRRIMIGWMQNWDTCVPPADSKWFGQMSIPREIEVKNGRLIQNPVRELDALHGRRVYYENIPIENDELVLSGVYGRKIDLTVTVRPTPEEGYDSFRIKFAKGSRHYSSVTYQPKSSTLRIDRSHSGFYRDFVHTRECFVRDRKGEIKIRIILDRFSAEVFINDGEQALTMTFYSPATADGISFEALGHATIDVEKYDIVK